MLTIETTELEISENLKKKVDMICKFACVKPKYNEYLIFEECDDIYVNGYNEKIKFKDLENYIKSN